MVMGLDKLMNIVEDTENMEAYFIYTEKFTGEIKTSMSDGFEKYIINY